MMWCYSLLSWLMMTATIISPSYYSNGFTPTTTRTISTSPVRNFYKTTCCFDRFDSFLLSVQINNCQYRTQQHRFKKRLVLWLDNNDDKYRYPQHHQPLLGSMNENIKIETEKRNKDSSYNGAAYSNNDATELGPDTDMDTDTDTDTDTVNSDAHDDEAMVRQIRRGFMASNNINNPYNNISRSRRRMIIVISDTTGVTAKAAVERSLSQFNKCDDRFVQQQQQQAKQKQLVLDPTNDDSDTDDDDDDDEDCEYMTTRVYPFVQTEIGIATILKHWTGTIEQEQEQGQSHNSSKNILSNQQKAQLASSIMVVFTLADPLLRDATIQMCQLAHILYVDLLGPMFTVMSQFFQTTPLGAPSIISSTTRNQSNRLRNRVLSDTYFRNIAAIEYTLSCDDGKSPHKWIDADVVLIGVSRTGKTPLSVVLAQTMCLKVANVPIVVDLPPPTSLLTNVNSQRVFCLILDVMELHRIRRYRLQREMYGYSNNVKNRNSIINSDTPTTSTASDWNTAIRNMSKKSTSSKPPILSLDRRVQASMNQYADLSYVQRDIQHATSLAEQYGFTQIDVTGRAVEETAIYIRSLLNERFPDS
jgi:regulator of PEP synthase PpsR (kinase-PPPase family)